MAPTLPSRFIGLDVHKHYLVAIGVNAQLERVFGPHTVQYPHMDAWVKKYLTPQDALVLEMSTNSFDLYDDLLPLVHSVTIVHPPHVALITQAQVKTDKKAAETLAQLHAAGLLPAVWVPPLEVRELRALVAQRSKIVRMGTQAKNRLHAALHRHLLLPPEGDIFTPDKRDWWLSQPFTTLEKARVQTDWNTLVFANEQVDNLEEIMLDLAAQDERVPRLLQLTGIGLVAAITLLAAIGTIERFPSARQLVGYSGFGTRVHDSGMTHKSGRITKRGRREIRSVMVQAANMAVQHHPKWQDEFEKKKAHLGYQRAIVTIARKLLVAVWHVLAEKTPDRFAKAELVANKMMAHAYRLSKQRRAENQKPADYVREQLDRLGLGADLNVFTYCGRKVVLPSSHLKEEAAL